MTHFSLLVPLVVFASGASALSLECSRRTFIGKLPATAATVAATSVTHAAACSCAFCSAQPANAYERRDVGGDNASAETKAMNLQAFETNSRLERSGLKMETSAEQSASLSAALSDYSYAPSSSSSKDKKGGSKDKKKPSTP